MSRSRTEKAGSATVYLVEELGDARLLCEQLKRYVDRAVQLIEKSEKKDHFFEVAGDVIHGIPETTDKLHQALQAVALATNRLDYEEVKQELRPEKVEELEKVLDEVRIRPVRRRGNPMSPEEAAAKLRSLADQTKQAGSIPLTETLQFLQALEDGRKTASAGDTAAALEGLATALVNPPEGVEGPSRFRLASVLRQELSKAITPEAVISHRVASRAVEARRFGADPKWITARYPGVASDGTPFKKGERVLYYPNTKTFLAGAKAEAAWRKFEAEVADEAFHNYTASEDEEGQQKEAGSNHFEIAAKEALSDIQNAQRLIHSMMGQVEYQLHDVHGPATVPLEGFARGQVEQTLNGALKRSYDAIDAARETVKKNTKLIAKLDKYIGTNFKFASDDEEKAARFEEGKPADPTENMSEEDAKKWKENVDHDGSNIKKEANDKTVRAMEKVVKTVEGNLKNMKSALDKYKSDPGKYAPQLDNFADDVRAISSAFRVFGRASGKTASDEGYESPLDKTAGARIQEPKAMAKALMKGADDILKARVAIRQLGIDLHAVGEDVSGTGIIYSGGPVGENRDKIKAIRRKLDNLDFEMGVFRDLEWLGKTVFPKQQPPNRYASVGDWKDKTAVSSMSPGKWYGQSFRGDDDPSIYFYAQEVQKNGGLKGLMLQPEFGLKAKKSSVRKSDFRLWKELKESDIPSEVKSPMKARMASEDEEKAARFEEGKPADPTENMSEEDAKKWKENVDHDGSNIKKVAANDFSKIKPGADVTLADNRGRKQTGKAKKKTPAGWMVEVNGRETLATPDNVVSVKTASQVDEVYWKA
jgi:hypothetical protein